MINEKKVDADRKLEEAYVAYSDAIIRYCNVRLKENKDAASDCMQNAFLIYYKKILSGEEIVNVKAFLYRTAENMCRQTDTKFLREMKRTVHIEEAIDIPSYDKEPFAVELDYDAIGERLIAGLSKEERQLYDLKYTKKLSLKEIGNMLDISPGAVANRTSRLRAHVKELIEPAIENYRKGGTEK